jgi:2-dehydropantoate 2-reductase
MREPGEQRATFEALVREMDALAQAMGIPFAVDIVETNLKTLDEMAPGAVASMQRDLDQGKPSEMDGLVFEPVRMGAAHGVAMPTYAKIAAQFGYKA